MNISKQAVLETIDEYGRVEIDNLRALRKAINALPSISDGWISVSDKVPCHAKVLVRTEVNYMGTASYEFETQTWYIDGIGPADNVTHFMYLPSSPTK